MFMIYQQYLIFMEDTPSDPTGDGNGGDDRD
jgi:hypothetical protein